MTLLKTSVAANGEALPGLAPIRLTVGHASDAGLRRAENEDAIGFRLAHDSRAAPGAGALFVVCDGIGGSTGGKKASRVAVRQFIDAYFAAFPCAESPGQVVRLPAARPEQGAAVRMTEALQEANRSVYQAAGRAGALGQMGTTLVAAAVLGADAYILNVGDSRAYLWRGGQLFQLSEDHVPRWREAGARSIDRAVGTNTQVLPSMRGPVHLVPGDRLLLCTDGLTTSVAEPVIAALVGAFSPAEAARQLIERAKTGGATDNISVLVVGAEAPWSEPRSGPAGETAHGQTRLGRWTAQATAVALRRRDPQWQRQWLPWLYLAAVLLVLLIGLIVGQSLAG